MNYREQIREKVRLRELKKRQKVVGYKLGQSAMNIKQKLLRFLTTFNPQKEEEDAALE